MPTVPRSPPPPALTSPNPRRYDRFFSPSRFPPGMHTRTHTLFYIDALYNASRSGEHSITPLLLPGLLPLYIGGGFSGSHRYVHGHTRATHRRNEIPISFHPRSSITSHTAPKYFLPSLGFAFFVHLFLVYFCERNFRERGRSWNVRFSHSHGLCSQ